MPYPEDHEPSVNDGVTGLLEQIATSMGVLASSTDGIEGILARIAAAAQDASGGSVAPSGPAGGDLSGTYPNPTVNKTLIILEFTVANGTVGGQGTANTWVIRPVNTVVYDSTGTISIASNTFVLPAGTWNVRASAEFFATDRTKIRLYNGTGAAAIVNGHTTFPGTVGGHAYLVGRFTVAAAQTLEFQAFIQTSGGTQDFGIAASSAVSGTSTFLSAEFWQ